MAMLTVHRSRACCTAGPYGRTGNGASINSRRSGCGASRAACAKWGFRQKVPLCSASATPPPESSDDADGTSMLRRSLLLGGVASMLPLSTSASAAPLTALPTIPTVSLAGGVNITRVIKGCWQLSGGHRGDSATDRTTGSAAIQDFEAFYNAGIRAWDCADHYGPAEALIGRYLREHPEQVPNISVLTKLCVFSGAEMSTLNGDAIKRAVKTSLSRLGRPSVDLMQFYWGDYGYPKYTDAIKYLGDSQAQGAITSVGVTNFDVPRLQNIVDTGVRIATNQVQYSLLDTRPENGMAQFCAQNGIQLLPYGVVAGGFLSEKYLGVPISKVKVDTYSKSKYGQVIVARGGWSWFQVLLQTLDGIAKKHNSTIANVASRWVLDRPGVAGVILGARNASHVQDHAALFTLSLDDADRAAIQGALDSGAKPKGDCYAWERGMRPF